MSNPSRIGIPLDKVGERLKQLNEAILENNMAIKADSGVRLNISSYSGDTALSVQIEVYLFEKEEKENG